jgi:hypothetical protein
MWWGKRNARSLRRWDRDWSLIGLKVGGEERQKSADLGGNVADMSRHCRSNFGQMGPCRRHKIEDVVAVCVGSSRHFPNFPKCVCRNILWYGSTYAQILNSHFCHVLLSWFCSFHQPPRSFIR